MFAETILWQRRIAERPLGKLTCMREDGVYFGVKAVTRTVRRKLEKQRWVRDNLSMIVGVPGRENEDDPWREPQGRSGGDGERLHGKISRQREYVLVQKRAHITREDLEHFWIHSEVPGMRVDAQGEHTTENCRRRTENGVVGHCDGGVSREADRAAERWDEDHEVSSRRRRRTRAVSDDRGNGQRLGTRRMRVRAAG